MTSIERKHINLISPLLALILGVSLVFGWNAVWPVDPVVEFQGTPVVEPIDNAAGGQIVITYALRRNESCSITIEPRFFNIDRNAFDGDVRRAAVANPTVRGDGDFGPFQLTLHLPENIYAGHWAYWPVVTPGDDCRSSEAVEAPFAAFRVAEERVCGGVRASASGRYHEPGSPWYDRVQRPVACFGSSEDAEAAGFERAGGTNE